MNKIINENMIVNLVITQFEKFISKKKFIKQNLNKNELKKVTEKQLCQEKEKKITKAAVSNSTIKASTQSCETSDQ